MSAILRWMDDDHEARGTVLCTVYVLCMFHSITVLELYSFSVYTGNS